MINLAIVFLFQIINLSTALAQRIDQIANRPLMHARHARQRVAPSGQRQRSGQPGLVDPL